MVNPEFENLEVDDGIRRITDDMIDEVIHKFSMSTRAEEREFVKRYMYLMKFVDYDADTSKISDEHCWLYYNFENQHFKITDCDRSQDEQIWMALMFARAQIRMIESL